MYGESLYAISFDLEQKNQMGNMENIERRKQTTIQNGKLGKKPG